MPGALEKQRRGGAVHRFGSLHRFDATGSSTISGIPAQFLQSACCVRPRPRLPTLDVNCYDIVPISRPSRSQNRTVQARFGPWYRRRFSLSIRISTPTTFAKRCSSPPRLFGNAFFLSPPVNEVSRRQRPLAGWGYRHSHGAARSTAASRAPKAAVAPLGSGLSHALP